MKFLADMNMFMGTVTYLRGQGHDVVHLRDQGLERLPDAGVVDKARNKAGHTHV